MPADAGSNANLSSHLRLDWDVEQLRRRLGANVTYTGASAGAEPETRFGIFAPKAERLSLVYRHTDGIERTVVMSRGALTDLWPGGIDGWWETAVPGVGPGTLYAYRINGQGPFPDPASRFQPHGVHGPSQVTEPDTFVWTDDNHPGIPLEKLVIYQIHVGTFSPEGTYAGVEARLDALVDLGVTALEFLPLADFPGRWNWGYDGVALFAPARCYGTPDDLRRCVNAARQRGLAVIFDVVYNHFGPDGNYTGVYSDVFVSRTHHTPWGAAINFDAPGAEWTRAFFTCNAWYWLREFHGDALRLDATHAIVDQSEKHFLKDMVERLHAADAVYGRLRSLSDANAPKPHAPVLPALIIAEDHRNDASMIRRAAAPAVADPADNLGLDGVWADDFHHCVRRMLVGDQESYFQDYQGSVEELATSLREGWIHQGAFSPHLGKPRGTDPKGISYASMVICIQNHDQIGNRAYGERLHHQITPESHRAAAALLLTAPESPLLFMGQEWAAKEPFLFFTDHKTELGRKVTEGRRREFAAFRAFRDAKERAGIPDPQVEATFRRCALNWSQRELPEHAGILRWYRALLQLRKSHAALQGLLDPIPTPRVRTETFDSHGLAVFRCGRPSSFLIGVCLKDTCSMDFHTILGERVRSVRRVVLSSEDPRFTSDPHPISVADESGLIMTFHRPGALVWLIDSDS